METTWEEFLKTREYIESKALELMGHEKKACAVTGVPAANYLKCRIMGRSFYLVQNNTFKIIINENLHKAQQLKPGNFGTGNAYDVLEAIYSIFPMYSLEWFEEFLRTEQFGYVFESEDGEIIDRILRLDLFRIIKKDKNGNVEFIGGLLHALKHFSKEGTNYSTGKYIHELAHPYKLIEEIIEAFFANDGVWEDKNKLIVFKPYDENYNLKFVFYREVNTGVFFLDTVYKEP